jgi:hypothetical protein
VRCMTGFQIQRKHCFSFAVRPLVSPPPCPRKGVNIVLCSNLPHCIYLCERRFSVGSPPNPSRRNPGHLFRLLFVPNFKGRRTSHEKVSLFGSTTLSFIAAEIFYAVKRTVGKFHSPTERDSVIGKRRVRREKYRLSKSASMAVRALICRRRTKYNAKLCPIATAVVTRYTV